MPFGPLRPIALAALAALTLAACSRDPEPDERTQALLGLVPADTPYVLLVDKPLPDELQRSMQALGAAEWRRNRDRLRALLEHGHRGEPLSAEAAQGLRVVDVLMTELEGAFSEQGAAELGLAWQGRTLVYGLGPFPVIRTDVADPAKVEAMLARVEQRSGVTAPRAELGDVDYRRVTLDERMLLAVAVVDDQLVTTVIPAGSADTLLPIAFGQQPPADSLADARTLVELRERLGYAGYAEGYVDLLALMRLANGRGEGLIQDTIAQLQNQGERKRPSQACMDFHEQLMAKMPRFSAGLSAVDDDGFEVKAVFETPPAVAKRLMEVVRPAPLPGMAADREVLLAFGLDLDIAGTRKALRDAMNWVADQGAACETVDAAAVRAAIPNMELGLGPMLMGISGAYLELGELAFDPRTGQPKTVQGGLLLAASDPRALLGMAAMINPALAQLQPPPDGSPLAVPPEALPPGVPPLNLAMADGLLALATGGDGAARVKAMLAADNGDRPALLSMAYDVAGFARVMGQAMPLAADYLEANGQTEEAAAVRDQLAAMQAQADHWQRMQMTLAPQPEGMVLRQRVRMR